MVLTSLHDPMQTTAEPESGHHSETPATRLDGSPAAKGVKKKPLRDWGGGQRHGAGWPPTTVWGTNARREVPLRAGGSSATAGPSVQGSGARKRSPVTSGCEVGAACG